MTDIEDPGTFRGLPGLTLPPPEKGGADPAVRPRADSVARRPGCAWEGPSFPGMRAREGVHVDPDAGDYGDPEDDEHRHVAVGE
ncbi:hypothetical protein [Streptomyces sp. NPDC091416]|uniref:hypothetical protein n=1 Tax=Streptomyces sp. NPDC091416 TaxID=3366003 RepID=UPI003826575C